MRVLLVVPWDQDWGGVASVVGNLAKHLARNGHDVLFFNPSDTNGMCEKKTRWGFRGFKTRLRTPFDPVRPLRSLISFVCFFPWTAARVLRLVRAQKIDIINIHYPGEAGIYFALSCFLLRRKLVVSVHGADFFPDGNSQKIPLLTRQVLRSAHAVVAPSQGFLNDVTQAAPEVRKKGRAIHNGIDMDEFHVRHAEHAAEITSEYVLCIAHQNKKKAIEVLINAFALIKERFSSLELVLVGDGPERPLLQELVKHLGLCERVRFVGFKNRADVAQFLLGCRLFALPSRSEPFGIVITEAMACKKAVVATRVGGIPEIIEDGKNGLLVSPDNAEEFATALISVLTHPEAARKMAEQGYLAVRERFTNEQMGKSYTGLFQRLLTDMQEARQLRSVATSKN
jgi:glycosyltransferase involved in cell wall biosynthesis